MIRQSSRQKAEYRKQAQRERILSAAKACFTESGFHGASMATISETAGVSAGLIYRYFDSKNAIILAIIDSQLAILRQRIRELHSTEYLANRIMDYFDEKEPRDDESMSLTLFLEISAQAARDPQIAEALANYDEAVRSELADWLQRSPEQGGCGLDSRIAPLRAFMLLSIIAGLKMQGVRDPGLDRVKLKRELERILQTLIWPSDGSQAELK